jgi:hypothetical protein
VCPAVAALDRRGRGNVYPQTGYQTTSPRELAVVLDAYASGKVSLRGVRVFFAVKEMQAVRDAARRSRPGRAEKGSCFRIDEVVRLTGDLGEATVRREVRRLANAGVLAFSQVSIRMGDASASSELLSHLACRRSPLRPIPVPRPVLRFLARCKKKSLMLTTVAYLVRGLSLERSTGAMKGRGTVKLSGVGRVFGLSERATRYARAELIRVGWISKDSGSNQRKLNRDGAYFELDLAWGRGAERPREAESVSHASRRFAPRTSKNGAAFAPPKERRVNYFVSKNQKTPGAPAGPAGVSTKRAREERPPILRDVKRADLENFSRTEALYRQAVKQGIVRESEASFLDWVAAAVRAKSTDARDPVRVFVGIVRRGLWHHIAQADEDRARAAILRYRSRSATVDASTPGRHLLASIVAGKYTCTASGR